MTQCGKCDGTGLVPSIEVGKNREPVPCGSCEGTGRIYGQAVNPKEMMPFKEQYGQIFKCSICCAVFAVVQDKQKMLGSGGSSMARTPHNHDLYEIMTGF